MTKRIKEKLKDKHSVSEEEVEQCFWTRDRTTLIDDREEHDTFPPTQWFIAETLWGRKLAVFFVQKQDGIDVKSAFEPTPARIALYMKVSSPRPDPDCGAEDDCCEDEK